MIAYLRGRLVAAEPSQLLVECAGVGYALRVSLHTYSALKQALQAPEVLVHTHLQIREDAHVLYGFATEAERGWFEQLLGISGVGSTTALAMLSQLSTAELQRAVASGDLRTLKAVKGIGEKTAQRILLELRGKLPPEAAPEGGAPLPMASLAEEATKALIALGFVKAEAEKRSAAALALVPEADLELLIKTALRS